MWDCRSHDTVQAGRTGRADSAALWPAGATLPAGQQRRAVCLLCPVSSRAWATGSAHSASYCPFLAARVGAALSALVLGVRRSVRAGSAVVAGATGTLV